MPREGKSMIAFDRGPRFDPGEIIVTGGAAERIPSADIQAALRRQALRLCIVSLVVWNNVSRR